MGQVFKTRSACALSWHQFSCLFVPAADATAPVTQKLPSMSTLPCRCPGLGAQWVVEVPGHMLGKETAKVCVTRCCPSTCFPNCKSRGRDDCRVPPLDRLRPGSGSPEGQGSYRPQVDLPACTSSPYPDLMPLRADLDSNCHSGTSELCDLGLH